MSSIRFNIPFFMILYDFEMFSNVTIDSGTRAYAVAAHTDNITCLTNPLVILFGAPNVRRRIDNLAIVKMIRGLWKREN